MSDYDGIYQRSLYLDPSQQDLLLAALASSNHFSKGQNEAAIDARRSNSQPDQPNGSSDHIDSLSDDAAGSGQFGLHADESPFLDFDLDPEFDLLGNESLIGDLPDVDSAHDESGREKRKSLDGQPEEESGKKRKENEDRPAKKPGRKPLTSEPTSVCVSHSLTMLGLSFG
jgi:AP-1-like factor